MILITGGGGFLGLNIARGIVDKGQEVLLVQRRPVEPPDFLVPFWGKEVKQVTGNILDLPFLLGLAKEYSIDSIIHGAFDTGHLANLEGPIKEHLHEFVQVPVQGAINLLEVARLFALRRLTLISSMVAYTEGPSTMGEWREDALLPPVSFSLIGNLKKAVEQICFLYSNIYEFSFVSLRVGWVYGPAGKPILPTTTMVKNALAGKPADLPMVAENRRFCTVYAKDVGELTSRIHLAESLKHPIYNVTDGGIVTIGDCAGLVKKFIPDAEISLGPSAPAMPGYVPERVSVDRVKDEFGFIPLDLEKGTKAYIDYLREGKY